MRKLVLLSIFVFLLASGSAMAGIIDIGGPMPSHSWYQVWNENGMLPDQLKPFNKIVITMKLGELEFLTPTTLDWTAAGNVFSYNGPGGSQVGEFDFITTFMGKSDVPLSFQYEVFMNDQRLSLQVADWDPTTGWSYEYPNNCVRPPVRVPEAGLSPLLLIGLAGAAFAAALIKY